MPTSSAYRIAEILRNIGRILRTLAGMSAMMRCSSDDEIDLTGLRSQTPRWRTFRWIVFPLLIALSAAMTQGGEPVAITRVPQPGEILRYKVKWHFVRLGTITVRTFRDSTCASPADYKLSMTVESNPDLSFVSIREYNESQMMSGFVGSRGFRAKHYDGETCTTVQRKYDEAGQTVVSCVRNGDTGLVIRSDTLHAVSSYVEGPSLFLFARCTNRTRGSGSIPTLVGGEMSKTDFQFDGEIEEVEVDACDQPVRTRKFTGFAHWTGGTSVGLTGEFTGWLSDDDAAVPMRAEMRTLLGPITLELEQWTRDGWIPPTTLQASTH
jgi:hypothetical protein